MHYREQGAPPNERSEVQASHGTAVHDTDCRERNGECDMHLIRPHSCRPCYEADHIGGMSQASCLQQAPSSDAQLAAQRSALSRATPETACDQPPGQTPGAQAQRLAGQQKCPPAGRQTCLPAEWLRWPPAERRRPLPRCRTEPSRWPGARLWRRSQSSWEGCLLPAHWSAGACRRHTCQGRGWGRACWLSSWWAAGTC